MVGRVEYGGLGITVRVVDEDPYPDAESMVADVRQRRLKVWASSATGNPHPYLSDGENDMFRAVHDVFGHAAAGRGFDPHGEEAAWLKHSGMYSPLARRALTTETRGQNCAQALLPRQPLPRTEGGVVAAPIQRSVFGADQWRLYDLLRNPI